MSDVIKQRHCNAFEFGLAAFPCSSSDNITGRANHVSQDANDKAQMNKTTKTLFCFASIVENWSVSKYLMVI